MHDDFTMLENDTQIIIYNSQDGTLSFDIPLDSDTVWLSLGQMSLLFERDKSVIARHIQNTFKEGELNKNSVVANFATTAQDGKSYSVKYYSLDMIISVGYRVKSHRGVQFRQWATKVLKEHLLNGYSLNSRKIVELERAIKDIQLHLKKKSGIDKEIIMTLKYLMERIDPNTTLFPK